MRHVGKGPRIGGAHNFGMSAFLQSRTNGVGLLLFSQEVEHEEEEVRDVWKGDRERIGGIPSGNAEMVY